MDGATRDTEGDSSNSPSSFLTADCEEAAFALFGDTGRASEFWAWVEEEECLECEGGDVSALTRARLTPESTSPRLETSSSSRDLRFSLLGDSGGEGGKVGGSGWRMLFKIWSPGWDF